MVLHPITPFLQQSSQFLRLTTLYILSIIRRGRFVYQIGNLWFISSGFESGTSRTESGYSTTMLLVTEEYNLNYIHTKPTTMHCPINHTLALITIFGINYHVYIKCIIGAWKILTNHERIANSRIACNTQLFLQIEYPIVGIIIMANNMVSNMDWSKQWSLFMIITFINIHLYNVSHLQELPYITCKALLILINTESTISIHVKF